MMETEWIRFEATRRALLLKLTRNKIKEKFERSGS